MKILKVILVAIPLFFIGVITAYVLESFFRGVIQDIFRWSTSGKIKFIGKDFHLFPHATYLVAFGLGILILFFENRLKPFGEIFKHVVLNLIVFSAALVIIASIDANLKVVECTLCDGGIRQLHWNEVNYELILTLSISASLLPNLLRIIKQRSSLN